MSLPNRSLAASASITSQGGQSALLSRIHEKKAELENLRQLKELSAAVADQMERLEKKLSLLSDGTEAIATVIGNWNSVLQAINMASMSMANPPKTKLKTEDDNGEEETLAPLPETLVRIPTEHAPTMQAHAEAVAGEGADRREIA